MTTPAQVDPRGLRVSATLTAVVLALVLVLPREAATVLLAVQVVVCAVSVFIGLGHSPYAQFFARVVRPRIGPPEHTEDARPPRFAQVVGLVFTAGGLIALLLGATLVGYVLVAFALVAALLNASIGLCLGCEMYLALRRFTPARAA
ncbi:DUF4395 domain-containing protein [Aeromicrobium sp. CF3.5]|uniref:DUF4395 domain-containing protein n=1 Tax=Aeromicrobium sp. CF3.5 TaxID=3373078 RepID=UPI003EE6C11B